MTEGQLFLAIALGLALGFAVFFGIRTLWGELSPSTLQVWYGEDLIQGTPGNDNIKVTEEQYFINGGAGNDRIDGGGGDEVLNGDEGDDILNGGPEDDFLNGGMGNDTIDGGAGADMINGDEGNDTIILGSDGQADVVDAGAGEDTILLYAGSVGPAEIEDLSCGDGADQVILKGFPADVVLQWPLQEANGGMYMNTGGDCETIKTEPGA